MSTDQCSACGRVIEAAPRCPQCGAEQPQWTDELTHIERSIAELKARDMEIAAEQKQLAAKMQAALFQRDILAHAGDQRRKQATRPRRLLRRHPDRRPPTVSPKAPPPRLPRQGHSGEDRPSATPTAPPRATVAPPPLPPAGEPGLQPEASSREVQNILLGLGALLLGIAAVVFAAVAISSLGDLSRITILVAATGLMLVAPTMVARRGLTSTAETIAAVGLLLVALDGYALWTVDRIADSGLSGSIYASMTFLITAIVASGYAGTTGLHTPRYAAVLALQPILPLLAYDWLTSWTGWALVLTTVAVADLYLGRLISVHNWLPGAGRFTRTVDQSTGAPTRSTTVESTQAAAAVQDGTLLGPTGTARPETAQEEADAILGTGASPSPSSGSRDGRGSRDSRDGRGSGAASAEQPATPWLRELTWLLHGLAIAIALLCAITALIGTDTVAGTARAGAVLLLASAVGLTGALALRQPPLIDLAAGVLALAVIGTVGRIATVALPGRALLLTAVVIALTGLGVRVVPEPARRGPQLASAATLIVIGFVVAVGTLRAALAPVRAALPVWETDLTEYGDLLASAVGSAGWQLASTAFLLTVAAALALPPTIRREFAVIGAALTSVAVPASFGLPWSLAPWPPVLAAIGIGVVGLTAQTRRVALVHVSAAGLIGLIGAAASLARPGLTSAVLFVLAAAGTLIALAPTVRSVQVGRSAELITTWAAGGAAFALPGAVAAFVAATVPVDPTPTAATIRAATEPVLAASFLAVCATGMFAAIAQVSWRRISMPLALGTGLGALAVTAAAFGAPGAAFADAGVGALLLVAAALLFLAPSIDAGRRADRLLDGSDFAAAAATAALIGTLARITGILTPGAELTAAACLILLVAVGIRTMPEDWRRGPVLGLAVSGAALALIAGYPALSGGLRALSTPGRIWATDLIDWPVAAAGDAWQAPFALVLLATAAAVALPRPWAYDIAGGCVGLATIGAPAALGLPWWSPIVVGGAVATGYGMAAVAAADPRAGLTRVAVAAAVALHAVGASLARPWATAAALGMVALIGVVVAVLARVIAGPPVAADGPNELPPHLAQIGGVATGGALLALPGTVAALAAALGWPPEIILTGAIGTASLAVAVLALLRNQVPQYLPYATVGVVGAATVSALAALFTDLPWGLYAAAAALLGVLAELIRAAAPPSASAHESVRLWSARLGDGRGSSDLPPHARWSVSPAVGAMVAAALPTVLAVAAVAPALVAALVVPYRTLAHLWAGPPPELTGPTVGAVSGNNVLATLLLTIAAAMAATGLRGDRPGRAVPVVLPGAAITLLIAPISLGLGWPTSTMAALGVFTIAMLGLALTPPPPDAERARSLRLARILVFVIGLAAGGAGLAGALATRELTLFTLGSAVGVGGAAALAGRTQNARILGWLFASIMAQLFVLTTGLIAGLAPVWSAFGVLAVGTVLLLTAATLPRLRRPEALHEAATVEWSGYAAALLAGALAYDSPRHIAVLLAAWGAVLGVSATRPSRGPVQRRILFWAAVGCEIGAWWLLMGTAHVALPEAYTLPFAALALLVGLLELRQRRDLSSWVAYGPALLAAFLPTLVIVLTSGTNPIRQVLLLFGGVAILIFGSARQQQAPVIIGAAVTALAALRALFSFGPWLVLIPVGLVLLALGASNESRRRAQERFRLLRDMR